MSQIADTSRHPCPKCGAEEIYDPDIGGLRCEYCGNTEKLDVSTDIRSEDESKDATCQEDPGIIVPFTVSDEDLKSELYRFMASGKYTPDDILERSTIVSIEHSYRPAYVFAGSFDATWTASFGYDHDEEYTVREKDSDGHMRWVTKTRTITDWRPVNGTATGSFCVLASAGLKSKTTSGLALDELIEGCKGVKKSVKYNPSYLAGAKREAFGYTANQTYTKRGQSLVNAIIDGKVRDHAQGDRQRNWHWDAQTSWEWDSVLIPLCCIKYEYNGVSYEFWADGTSVSHYVADPLPEDTKRKQAVFLGFAPVGVTLLALFIIGYATSAETLFNHDGDFPFTALFIGIIYAFIRRFSILQFSKKYRKFAAESVREESSNTGGRSEPLAAPTRSFIANTALDIFLLPGISVSLILLSVSGLLFSSLEQSPRSVTLRMTTTDTQLSKTPDHVQDAQNSVQRSYDLPSAAPAPSSSVPTQEPAHPTEPALTSEPVVVEPQVNAPALPAQPNDTLIPHAAEPAEIPAAQIPKLPATEAMAPVVDMLAAASQNSWQEVDNIATRIVQASTPLPHTNRRQARIENDQGLALLGKGEFSEASLIFLQAEKEDPADNEIVRNLGYAMLREGRSKDSIRVFGASLIRDPTSAPAWINLSEAAALQGDASGAKAAMRLSIHYNHNRNRLEQSLAKWAADAGNTSPVWQETLRNALSEMSGIPEYVR